MYLFLYESTSALPHWHEVSQRRKCVIQRKKPINKQHKLMTAWRSEFRHFFIYHYTTGYAQHPRTPPPSSPHSSPLRYIFRVLFTPHPEGESVDKWRRCALGLSCLRSGEAIYERALAGFTVINRRRPPRPQAGQGQPALHCLDREITSKRPAACVKKILHSGSAQMNPGGARNCF